VDKTNQLDSNGLRHGLWITERQIHPRIKDKYNIIHPRTKGNVNIVDVIHSFYIHGILNGISKVFREDKLIYSCNYKNGLWNGREFRMSFSKNLSKNIMHIHFITINFYDSEIYEGENLEINL